MNADPVGRADAARPRRGRRASARGIERVVHDGPWILGDPVDRLRGRVRRLHRPPGRRRCRQRHRRARAGLRRPRPRAGGGGPGGRERGRVRRHGRPLARAGAAGDGCRPRHVGADRRSRPRRPTRRASRRSWSPTCTATPSRRRRWTSGVAAVGSPWSRTARRRTASGSTAGTSAPRATRRRTASTRPRTSAPSATAARSPSPTLGTPTAPGRLRQYGWGERYRVELPRWPQLPARRPAGRGALGAPAVPRRPQRTSAGDRRRATGWPSAPADRLHGDAATTVAHHAVVGQRRRRAAAPAPRRRAASTPPCTTPTCCRRCPAWGCPPSPHRARPGCATGC